MTHVVHHLDADGSPAWESAADLDAALARVEQLQHDGAAGVRVFSEVPIRIETIYRVSVATAAEAAGADGTTAAREVAEIAPDPSTPDPTPAVEDAAPVAEAAADPVAEADEDGDDDADAVDEDAILAAVGAVAGPTSPEAAGPVEPPPGSAFLDPPSGGAEDNGRRGGLFGRG